MRVTVSLSFESPVSPRGRRTWPTRIENTSFGNNSPLSRDFHSLEQLCPACQGVGFFPLGTCHRKVSIGAFVLLEPCSRPLEDRVGWFVFNCDLRLVRRWFSQWSLRGHTAALWNFRSLEENLNPVSARKVRPSRMEWFLHGPPSYAFELWGGRDGSIYSWLSGHLKKIFLIGTRGQVLSKRESCLTRSRFHLKNSWLIVTYWLRAAARSILPLAKR